MTYGEAVKYILDIPKFSKKNSAEHTGFLLNSLGNPQDAVKVIHVAGTNGKGSVCAYLDAMLRSEGVRTGLFTSPHLVKINERIVIDGSPISDDAFVFIFDKVLSGVKKMEDRGMPHPTFFEFLFVMGLTAFAEAGADYVVLETGLGGRLDATNTVAHPLVSVITSIGMDHMEYLGNTLAQIAGEKAGIIKPGVPVFFSETSPESDRIIESKAKKCGSSCKKIGKDAYEILGIEEKRIAFSPASDYYGNTTWKLNNIGVYQPANAILAMEVMRSLFGSSGRRDLWRKALSDVKWAGRMEEILPDVYVDGAHNVSAVEAFARSVLPDERGRAILFSAVKDKDYAEMISRLCRDVQADFYVVTMIENSRGARAEELGRLFERHTDKPVIVTVDVKEAFDYILAHREGRRVYCLGSLYLAGMIKELIQEEYGCSIMRKN